MESTRTAVLQEIGNEIKNANGLNLIWRRGSPGVGKSALAASTAIWPEDQKRRVISFRFEVQGRSTNRDSGQRRQIEDRLHQMSSIIEGVCGDGNITTNALWRAMACDLARLYSYLWPHLAQGYQLGDLSWVQVCMTLLRDWNFLQIDHPQSLISNHLVLNASLLPTNS